METIPKAHENIANNDVVFLAASSKDEIALSNDVIVLSATNNPDTFFLNQAMKQTDRQNFIDARGAEVAEHER